MALEHQREHVSFITTEEADDLIVSFAIAGPEPADVVSLTLLRTPKYEALLDEHERGVSVSHESFPEHDEDRLWRISVASNLVVIETTSARYELDVSRVAEVELRNARRILRRMNFDQRFALELA